jgi:hypothetical protein
VETLVDIIQSVIENISSRKERVNWTWQGKINDLPDWVVEKLKESERPIHLTGTIWVWDDNGTIRLGTTGSYSVSPKNLS